MPASPREKGGVVEGEASGMEMGKGRLQPEQDGGIGAQRLHVELAALSETGAGLRQAFLVIWQVVAAQLGQGSALADAHATRLIGVAQVDKVYATCRIDAPRRPGRSFEMERPGLNVDLVPLHDQGNLG